MAEGLVPWMAVSGRRDHGIMGGGLVWSHYIHRQETHSFGLRASHIGVWGQWCVVEYGAVRRKGSRRHKGVG